MNKTAEDELATIISNEIAQAIDEEIMADMLVSIGWTKIRQAFPLNNRDAVDRHIWLEETCSSKFKEMGSNILFENTNDAAMFILKWQ